MTNFDWTDSTFDRETQKVVEELLIEFHDIFARHRVDIGIKNDFKVKFTPIDESPAYSQRLPTPINLREDVTVDLAIPHKYGIIITVPFSKNASRTFAQRKPKGKLCLLVGLR